MLTGVRVCCGACDFKLDCDFFRLTGLVRSSCVPGRDASIVLPNPYLKYSIFFWNIGSRYFRIPMGSMGSTNLGQWEVWSLQHALVFRCILRTRQYIATRKGKEKVR